MPLSDIVSVFAKDAFGGSSPGTSKDDQMVSDSQ
jgi:hypothetical protein